jgi:glycosyltransferase involved in cell wall biosynthesis
MTAAINFRKVPTVGVETSPCVDCNGRASIPGKVPSRAHTNWHMLQGALICHFSSNQRYLEPRSFYMESVPAAAMGLRPKFIAPHGINGHQDGVDLVSIRRSKHPAVRILLASLILLRLLRSQADIYQLHDPELLPVGLLLKLVFRKKVVYDTCEDFPLMMLTKPWIPRSLRSFAAKIVSCFEWLAARWLDGIVTADSDTLRRFAKEGRSKKRVFYNFPSLDLFPEPKLVSKKFDIVYRGGLSVIAGTLILLDAVGRLAEKGLPVRLLLIGYFDNERAERLIRERIQALGPDVLVELRGQIDHSAMSEALAEAKIGVCPLQAIPKFLHNIPVKVWEYWACGLPVIASDLPPIRPFFQICAGLLVKPDDPGELAAAMRQLLHDPRAAERMGANGRRAVEERLNNHNQVRGLLSFYKRVLSQGVPS